MLWILLLMAATGAAPTQIEVAPGEGLTVLREGPVGDLPVVLVPGLSGSYYGFRHLTPLLHAQGRETVIVEPLAVGESARPGDADYTLTAQAGRLAAVLDQLEIDRALFVAQGVGGGMVFRLAAERPDLVAGFVSIEGGPAEIAISPDVRSSLTIAKGVAKLGGRRVLRDRFADRLRQGSGDAGWVDRRTVGRYFRGTGRDINATLDAMSAMTRQTEPWTMAPRLDEIKIPVLVLRGTAPHKGQLSDADLAVMRTGLAMVEIRDVAGAGHFIQEEQPEAVAGAVADLVRRIGGGESPSTDTALVPGDDGRADPVEAGDDRQ